MANPYCLCGNYKVRHDGNLCKRCKGLYTVPGAQFETAYQFFKRLNALDRACCKGNSQDGPLYFHGKYWDSAYGIKTKRGTWRLDSSVEVESGIKFYEDHARTYYMRDFDDYCDSKDYGADIPYNISFPEFMSLAYAQINEAAEYAFNSDLLSCPKCGYHYSAYDGICRCRVKPAGLLHC